MKSFYEKFWEGDGYYYCKSFKKVWPILERYLPHGQVRIVDFGCGIGMIVREIKKRNPDAKIIGLDVSRSAVDRAKKLCPTSDFFEIDDGEHLPLESESVDFVLSIEVIEHVYDVENLFSEIARVLKPGGKLFLTTPYHGFLKNLLIAFFAFDRHFNPVGPHVRFFTKKTLNLLLHKYGFKVNKRHYFSRFYPLSHSMVVFAEKVK